MITHTQDNQLLEALLGAGPEPHAPRAKAGNTPPPRRVASERDLIRLIGENQGPGGLDLTDYDLSGLDLSSTRIGALLEEWYAQGQTKLPVWVSEAKKTSPSGAAFWKLDLTDERGKKLAPKEISRRYRYGINLSGANLSGANLSGANLQRADLSGATLVQTVLEGAYCWASVFDGANLWSARLKHANLAKASLAGAILSKANLEGADCAYADLDGADLSRANLADVTFFAADLAGADLTRSNFARSSFWRASIQGARIDPDILGTRLLQEDEAAFSAHLGLHMGAQPNSSRIASIVGRRYREARDGYLALKANFQETGDNAAASLAHYLARRAEKRTHHPRWARHCYGVHYREAAKRGRASLLRFHLGHWLQWVLAWGAELTCGYGERPLRVAGVSVVVVALFALLFWLTGGVVTTTGGPVTWSSYLQYSLATFCTIGFPTLAPAHDLAMLLSSVEAFLGIACLALLMFALGNRISRS